MTGPPVRRRLAAILAADVVGYSRLMGADEAATLDALFRHRAELIDPAIADHGGRIVKTMGDGLLVEFASVVDAVSCAAAIQDGMARRNQGLADEVTIAFRIGINLGDVIVRDDDVYGDGVNVAARLEALAEPGGVCISGEVEAQIRGKLDLAFDDLGPTALKNIDRPVHVFSLHRSPASGEQAMASLALPDKPSIAVLPFQNMSGDAEQEYFADGITEDIITALAKFRWFFVVARNSTFAYKGRAGDLKQVARELGVRYLLEGSVRKMGGRVRITAQLIDGASGGHLWAERYDRDIEDVFALQDEITATVAATVEPALYAAEGQRAARVPPEDLAAWDYVMRALPHVWRLTGEDNARARELLRQAIALDPNYGQAYSLLAMADIFHVWMGWGQLPADALSRAREAARKAAALDEQDPWAHLVLGMVYGYGRNHEEAVAELGRAIGLNPSFALAHGMLGLIHGYAARTEEALAEFDLAERLSPRDPFNAFYDGGRSVAVFAAGRDEEVIACVRRSLRERPEYVGCWRMWAISAAHLGRMDEARHALAEAKRLQPGLTLTWARAFAPWTRPEDLDRYVEGFRLAGLEEG